MFVKTISKQNRGFVRGFEIDGEIVGEFIRTFLWCHANKFAPTKPFLVGCGWMKWNPTKKQNGAYFLRRFVGLFSPTYRSSRLNSRKTVRTSKKDVSREDEKMKEQRLNNRQMPSELHSVRQDCF